MAHKDWEQLEREIQETDYMRYAAGAFARAAAAERDQLGQFAVARRMG